MLAFILSLKTVPNVCAYRPDFLFQEQLGVQRSHIGLKADQADYKEHCSKTIPRRVDPVECYRLLY